MAIFRDLASHRPRVSVTKLAATGQGLTALTAAAVMWANRRYDLGLDQESILLAAGGLVALTQAVSTWAQRRASERIERKLSQAPSGRTPGGR